MYKRQLYSTPWDKKPNIACFCNDECEQAYTDEGDFSYQTCSTCGRDICVRNPSNGYLYQFRDADSDGDHEICLQCYQNRYIKSGLSLDEINADKIPGIFFDTDALLDAGYVKQESRIKVHSGNVSEVRDIALQYVNQDAKVLYDYDSMSILGDEGYINIWVRFPNQEQGPAQAITKPNLVIDIP